VGARVVVDARLALDEEDGLEDSGDVVPVSSVGCGSSWSSVASLVEGADVVGPAEVLGAVVVGSGVVGSGVVGSGVVGSGGGVPAGVCTTDTSPMSPAGAVSAGSGRT
jgi:hypothetical protein